MKTAKLRYLVILIILILLSLGIFWVTAIFRLPLEKRKINVLGREISVWVAETEKQRRQGLQNIIWLPKNTGMLFVFPRADIHCFWNKNTPLPLKLIFMQQGKVVEQVFLPSIRSGLLTVCPREAVDSVLEIPE